MATISVFCDGSLTNSLLSDIYESSVGPDYTARAMVVIPNADVGVISQTTEGMLTPRGTPASENAELFAIKTALDLCRRRQLSGFVIYSDCQGAVAKCAEPSVEWRSREQLRLPNDFFDKVLRRASYLRRTDGKVKRRVPPQAHQIEIFELFNATRREFRLSESALWLRVRRDAERTPQALVL